MLHQGSWERQEVVRQNLEVSIWSGKGHEVHPVCVVCLGFVHCRSVSWVCEEGATQVC